jgi:hypothetical protein
MKQSLLKRISDYTQQRNAVRAYIKRDPTIPTREKKANSEKLLIRVQELRDIWSEVLPYIRRIKTLTCAYRRIRRHIQAYFLFLYSAET